MNRFPTAEALGREALESLSRRKETPEEHFDRLVQQDWINRQGEVTRLLGGNAEPEPDSDSGRAALRKGGRGATDVRVVDAESAGPTFLAVLRCD